MRYARLAVLILACVLPASASAAPYTAPGNKVLWGGQGGYSAGHIADFERQSGKHPAVFNYFIDWGSQDGFLGGRLDDARRMGSSAMLSLSTKGTRLSPRDLAQGGGDRFLIRLTGVGRPRAVVYGPLSEKKRHNPYSAYTCRALAGPAYATGQSSALAADHPDPARGTWAAINSNLRSQGMPALRPARRAAWPRCLVWSAVVRQPRVPKNHPSLLPGGGYVDWWAHCTAYRPSAMNAVYNSPGGGASRFLRAWGVWGAECRAS